MLLSHQKVFVFSFEITSSKFILSIDFETFVVQLTQFFAVTQLIHSLTNGLNLM